MGKNIGQVHGLNVIIVMFVIESWAGLTSILERPSEEHVAQLMAFSVACTSSSAVQRITSNRKFLNITGFYAAGICAYS
jgi:hypothetical protein